MGCFFTDKDGKDKLVFHVEPEPIERMRILEIKEVGDNLYIKQ